MKTSRGAQLFSTGTKLFKKELKRGILFITSMALLSIFAPLSALGQDKGKDAVGVKEAQALLADTLEARVVTILSRILPKNDFDVVIDVKIKDKVDKPSSTHPYLPQGLSSRALADMTPQAMNKYVQSLTISVLLADYFTKKTQKQVEELLTLKLLLNKERGDRVTFGKLVVETKENPSEVDKSLRRAEDEARTNKTKLDSLGRERDDIKTELTIAKSELEKLRKNARLELDKFSMAHKVTLAIGVLLVIGLFALGLMLRSGAKIVATSFKTIGDSLPVLGDKLAEASGRGGGEVVAALDVNAKQLSQGSGNSPQEPQTPRLPAMSMESMQSRILALHKELNAALTENTEVFVIEYLGRLLDAPATVSRAVLTLELIGDVKAKSIYGRLGPEHQVSVKEFVASGKLDAPKLELMIEAGEDLKTKLLGEVFGGVRQNTNDKVSSRIAQLRLDDLAAMAKSLKGDLLPRFLLYFEAKRLGALLTLLKQKDKDQYAQTIKALAKVPGVEQDTSLDPDLIQALDEQLTATKDDSQRFFLRWYKSITESIDDDLVEDVTSELVRSSPRFARFIQEQIITFSTFFKLRPEIRAEIVQGTNNKDLGALVAGFTGDVRNQILAILDQRRRETVAEEADRLTARGSRLAQESHRQAKKKVLGRILAIKGQGMLIEILAGDHEAKASEPSTKTGEEAQKSAA